MGRKRKEARWEVLQQRSRKQVDCCCVYINSSSRLPGTSVAATIPSNTKRNAFSHVTLPQQPGDISVRVDEPGPVCTSAILRSLLLFLVMLVESQEQWIWELKVIRLRDDVPVSAQAFATVVTPMRPLVP